MSEFKFIGHSLPRRDGLAKATGEARFTPDYSIPGCWIGGIVRSPVARGTLKGFHRSETFDWSKVVFLTATDVPGDNRIPIVRDDFPVLTDGPVSYVAEPLALIAAPDAVTLKAALAASTPDIDVLPPALTVEEGLAGTVKVWGDDNILDEYRVECGDLEKGFAEADLIIEETYHTAFQEQLYLETQGAIAVPRPDGVLELIVSLQCPFYVSGAAARALDLPPERLVVRQPATGGAFGGKEDYPSMMAVWAGLLALRSGHPVRLIFDRHEDLEVTPKRHPSRVHQRTGFKKDGTITAMDVDLVLNGGAYTTLSRVVLQRSTLHASGAYRVPNARIRGRAVATNTPPSGAFRGFGAPQALFAVERQMDKAARELGMDPLDLRLKNVMHRGDQFPFGQILREEGPAPLLERAALEADYRRKRALYEGERASGGTTCRGIGLSVAMHGGGFTGSGEDAMGTTVTIDFTDGRFRLLASSVDMGQGSMTVLPMVAAETLGVGVDDIDIPPADSDLVPNSGPTVASRTTMFVGAAVQDAASDMIERLRAFLARREGCEPADLSFADGIFRLDERTFSVMELAQDASASGERLSCQGTYHSPAPRPGDMPWDDKAFRGDAYKGYAWQATVVELEIDRDTYEANPTDVTVVVELGRVIHPALAAGQLTGGTLQSLGWAHIEDLDVTAEGRFTAAHMSSYMVPTTLDTPNWRVTMLEEPCAAGGFGAKGIGELPCDGPAPAFLSALDNGLDVFPTRLPATGEYLYSLLTERARPNRTSEGEQSCASN